MSYKIKSSGVALRMTSCAETDSSGAALRMTEKCRHTEALAEVSNTA